MTKKTKKLEVSTESTKGKRSSSSQNQSRKKQKKQTTLRNFFKQNIPRGAINHDVAPTPTPTATNNSAGDNTDPTVSLDGIDLDTHKSLPKEIKFGCKNKIVREICHRYGRVSYKVLRRHRGVRDPTNDFAIRKLRPLPKCSSLPLIYAKYKNLHSLVLDKIGYTSNINNSYDKDDRDLCFVMVTPRCITPECDRELVENIDKMLDEICDNEEIPIDFRRLFIKIRDRGADALGLKKALYYMVIEIGCQLEFEVSVPAEVFTTGEEAQAQRRSHVKKETENMIKYGNVKGYVGKDIEVMSTWATGQDKSLLTSEAVLNDFMAGAGKWTNALPNPVYPNAKTLEEIYSREWDESEIRNGRSNILSAVSRVLAKGSVLVLAKNEEKLFPQDGLLKLLKRKYGFVEDHSIHDGRIISLSHPTKWGKIVIFTPLGFAFDSRSENYGAVSTEDSTSPGRRYPSSPPSISAWKRNKLWHSCWRRYSHCGLFL